jgi:hypothetical protein
MRLANQRAIQILHIVLHFLLPLPFAAGLYKKAWLKNYAFMLAGLLIDVDHLLANPVYDAERCSLGFHPLHTLIPIVFYALLLLHPKTRAVAIGLCLHILWDGFDCFY